MKHTKVILGPRYDYWPRDTKGEPITILHMIKDGIDKMTMQFGKRPEIFYVGRECATKLQNDPMVLAVMSSYFAHPFRGRPKSEIMELFGCSIRQSRREGIRGVLKDDGFGKIVFDRIDNLK